MAGTPQVLSQQRRQNSIKDRRSPTARQGERFGAAEASKTDGMSKSTPATRAAVSERAMGHRETRSVVDRLEKENFDLKLRITLQEERMARMVAELDDALALSKQIDELRRERDRLRDETAESLEMNEQLVRELEQRDFAVEEAAGIIQEMEERMEDVQHALAEGENEWRKHSRQRQVDGYEVKSLELNGCCDEIKDDNTVTTAMRDCPPTTKVDGENSRPSTAVHDSDYFSAESSPTRSLTLQQQQQQQQRELRPLSSYIRLLGRPSTVSLISEFSMAEPSIMSFRSDAAGSGSSGGNNDGSRSRSLKAREEPASATVIGAPPVLSLVAAKSTKPQQVENYSDQASNQLTAASTIQEAGFAAHHPLPSLPQSSSLTSSHEDDDEGEEEIEKTVILDKAFTSHRRAAASRIDNVKFNQHHHQQHQPRKLGRSQSVRVADPSADIRGDFQKGEQQQIAERWERHHEPRASRPQSQDRQQQYGHIRQYQQRNLYRNVNQVTNTFIVSTPDARLVAADAGTNVTADESIVSGLMPLQPMDRQQQQQQKFHPQSHKSLHQRNLPFSSFTSLSGRPGLDLKRDCEGKWTIDGINGSEKFKDKKAAAEKGSSKKEKGKERFHLVNGGEEKKGSGSPYAPFLAAAASLKAFTNITNAASARLARAAAIGAKPAVASISGKPDIVDCAAMHASLRGTVTSSISVEPYNDSISSGSSYENATNSSQKRNGFAQKPVRPTRPRANTTSNITSISSAGRTTASSTGSTIVPPATSGSPHTPARTLTISTPTTNKQHYLILHGHHRTNSQQAQQQQGSRQSRPASRSTSTQDDLTKSVSNRNMVNGRLARSVDGSTDSGNGSNDNHDSDMKNSHAHVRSRLQPPTLQHSQTIQNLSSQPTSSSSTTPPPTSPTPTTTNDPTESTCSFNVETWGGPPAYKALPREGTWVGMGGGVRREQVGPPPRNLFFDGSDL